MSQSDTAVYIHHMLDYAREARGIVDGRSRSNLDSDKSLRFSLLYLMTVIGEAAGRVPGEFRSRHPQIPCRGTINLRNGLVHGYDRINDDILWDVVQNDLPLLIAQLQAIIERDELPEM